MKQPCFICDAALRGRRGTVLFREQRGAHMNCLWRVAVALEYGE